MNDINNLDLELEMEEIEDLQSSLVEEDTGKKEFTYNECIKFSEEKSKAIIAYQFRAVAVVNLINRYIKLGKNIDPKTLLEEISKIDFMYPLV